MNQRDSRLIKTKVTVICFLIGAGLPRFDSKQLNHFLVFVGRSRGYRI